MSRRTATTRRARPAADAAPLAAEPGLRAPTSGGRSGSGTSGKKGGKRKPRRAARRKAPRRWLRGLLKWGFVAMIWAGIAGSAIVGWAALGLPDIDQVAGLKRRPAIQLLDADGRPFARLGDLGGEAVRIGDLPPHLVQAVLAVEDRNFYRHVGFDPIGILRAAWTNHRQGRVVQGASTITQQLAKNLFLTPDRTYRRKLQELLLALWLEQRYDKDQLLAAYLNRVYLGSGAFGIDAAARAYFGKPAAQVNRHEAAVLAGLLKAPSRYAPTADPQAARRRADVVLAAMVDAGVLSPTERSLVRDEPLGRPPVAAHGMEGRYAADWLAEQVSAFVGGVDRDLVVRTTMRPALQAHAERVLRARLAAEGAEAKAGQAALVALAPDGAVLALVGGRDYGDSQYNRATQAKRQPGSAFKPIVYLAALERGLTPDSVVEDSPVRLGDWSPGNFDGRFRGPIPLREALAHSVNTVAVRLADQAGIDAVISVARRLGIESDLARDLSLALGTSDVSLLELTASYAALANGGQGVVPYGVVEVRDRSGEVLYRRQGSGLGPVADAGAIAALGAMLRDAVAQGTGRAAALDRPVAGKTGTSQDYRDAWFVGFTADAAPLVAGVWVGNDDRTPMNKVTGGGLPARLWRDFMAGATTGAGAP